jgi:hypothetical protein
MWWDRSEGKLYFRSGTTVAGTIGTGGIDFELGSIGGWNFDATTLYDDVPSTIVLDSSVPSINVNSGDVLLDSSGITAIAGTIAGWTISSSLISKSAIKLDSSADKITVNDTDVVLNSSGITAIAGAIGGWTLASTTLTGGDIVLDQGNNKISVGTGISIDGSAESIWVGSGSPQILIDGTGKLIRSTNYSADLAGFKMDSSGQAEFQDIKARGSIIASIFEYGHTQVVGGDIRMSKDAGRVGDAGFTTPAVSATVSVSIRTHEDGSTWGAVNDIIQVKTFDGSTYVSAYLELTTFTGNSTDSQTGETVSVYTATMKNGDVAVSIPAGTAVINYGSSGGIIGFYAGEQTTRMIVSTTAGQPWTDITTKAVIGNMRDEYGTGSNDRYGFGVGDYSAGNFMSYNAKTANQFVLSASDGNLTISATDGMTIIPTSSFNGARAITWRNIGDTQDLAALYVTDGASTNTTHLRAYEEAGDDTNLSITSQADGGQSAEWYLTSEIDLGVTNNAYLQGTTDNTTSVFWSTYDYNKLTGGLAVGPNLNAGVGDIIAGGCIQIGGAHLQSATDGHLYLNDQSANKYAFIEGAGNIYLSSNMYFNGSTWKTLQTGKSSYVATQGFGGTNAFVVTGDNTSRSANATASATSLFQVLMDGTGAVLPTGGAKMAGGLRVEGSNLTTGYTGNGVELAWISTYARLLSYNRSTAQRKPLNLDASPVNLQINGTTVNFADTNGFNMTAGRNFRIHNGTSYVDGGIYVKITAKTHSSFNGTAKTTSGPTSYAVSGWNLPSDALAMWMRLIARDSATHVRTNEYAAFGPSSSDPYQLAVHCIGNDHQMENCGIVNITSGAVWFRCVTSGTNTMDVWSVCYGYWK